MSNNLHSSNQSRLSTRNQILSSLLKEDFERLLPDLERIDLPSGKILFHPDELINYIYFPETAMISVVAMTAEGQSIEARTIGWEGMAEFNVLMGADSMPNENIVQLPGNGFRMTTSVAKQEFERNPAFQKLVLSFINRLMGQMG